MDLAVPLTSDGPSAASIGWLVLVIAACVASVVLFVAGVVSVLRTPHLGAAVRVVWLLVMLVFPVVGPLAWFLVGRRSARTPSVSR